MKSVSCPSCGGRGDLPIEGTPCTKVCPKCLGSGVVSDAAPLDEHERCRKCGSDIKPCTCDLKQVSSAAPDECEGCAYKHYATTANPPKAKVLPEDDLDYSNFWELVERARFELREGIEPEHAKGVILASEVLTKMLEVRIRELEAISFSGKGDLTTLIEEGRRHRLDELRGLLPASEKKEDTK